jgi:hypothetical protein
MTINLAMFMLIVLVFMFAFGVCVQSLMFPNQPLNRMLFSNVFFPSFFVIGGDYSTNLGMMIATVPSGEFSSKLIKLKMNTRLIQIFIFQKHSVTKL